VGNAHTRRVTSCAGANIIHFVDVGPVCQVQLVLVPNGPRDACGGRGCHARVLLRESEAQGWHGYPRLGLWCVLRAALSWIIMAKLCTGWGSLSLFLASKYPKSRIVGLSNSNTQREYIMSTAQARGLNNLQVRRDHIIVLCPDYLTSQILTGDVNVFDFTDNRKFDRVLSIEVRRSSIHDMF